MLSWLKTRFTCRISVWAESGGWVAEDNLWSSLEELGIWGVEGTWMRAGSGEQVGQTDGPRVVLQGHVLPGFLMFCCHR